MGYVRKTLKLVFDDPDFEGLEVRAKRLNVEQLLDLAKLETLKGMKDDSPQVRDGLKSLFTTLAGLITSWNLEEPVDPADPDGPTVAVPVTTEALAALDMGFVMSLVLALQEATVGVSGPLVTRSPSGGQSLEASLPMEVESSPSLLS